MVSNIFAKKKILDIIKIDNFIQNIANPTYIYYFCIFSK